MIDDEWGNLGNDEHFQWTPQKLRFTKQEREKIKKATEGITKKSWQDPKIREKRIEGLKRAYSTPEVKEKRSKALRGVVKPLEGNAKVSEHRKGWTYTEETKQKIAETLTGRTHNRSRSVMTPKGEFAKMKDAGVAFNVSESAIRLWVKDDNKPEFYYTNDSSSLTKRKKVTTPDGTFDDIDKAAEFYNITGKAISYRIKKWDGWNWEE